MTDDLKRFIKQTIYRLVQILSYIIPKKKSYWVFTPIHDRKKISGNIKALLFYVREHHPEMEISITSENKDIWKDALAKNIKTNKSFISLLWNFLRAEHIILDATYSSSPFNRGNFSIIQLWHGTGFKNIGLLDEFTSKKKLERFKHIYSHYRVIVATSELDVQRKNDSFGIEKSIVTGSPRNDVFFEEKSYLTEIKRKYELQSYKSITAYTPTFRDLKAIPPFTDNFWRRLNEIFKETNQIFVVKKHPWDKDLVVPQNLSHIKDLTGIIDDVQELLLISDQLVTDYSGIMTDFAITGRPILIYCHDLEEYIAVNRSFYYDITKVLPKPFIKTEEELLEKIIDDSWTQDPEFKESYQNFRNTFHKYFDGNSSKRVTEAILSSKANSRNR